jgi:hypothetical protein
VPSLPAPVYHGRKQQAKPLTHHEILSLIAPFTRRGRHADLSASDRVARRLAFRPVEHDAGGEGEPALREDLTLEAQESGQFRLVRTITLAGGRGDGIAATLTADGADAGALLAQVEAVPVRRQIKLYRGIPLARSYHLVAAADEAASRRVVIVAADATVEGVTLAARADRTRGMPVDIKLTVDPGAELRVPQDLLAVLGWTFRPLVQIVSYWRGTINAPRREPKRTPVIEARLGRAVTHLADTLRRSPVEFHPRHRRARWRVAIQRAIPLLTGLAILAATPGVRLLELEDNSVLRMLIFHAPPFMLVGFFLMREMPRLEIPPLPRPLRNRAWILASGDDAARSRLSTRLSGDDAPGSRLEAEA